MKQIYKKTTRELMKEFLVTEKINKDDKFNRTRIKEWFRINYPKIKIGTIDAHITVMTVNAPSRIHYNVHSDGSDDLFIKLDDGYLRLYDRVVGQLLRYIGWIKSNLADKDQDVRGIIIARKITEDLKIACSEITKIKLFEYNLSITLNSI